MNTLTPATRGLLIGSLVLGSVGAVVGLVLGLVYYPPTAWAAMVEVGALAAVLGGLIGLAAGAVCGVVHRRWGSSG